MDKPTLKTNQLIFVRALTVLSLLRFCSSCCPFTLARRSRPGSGRGGEAQVSQVALQLLRHRILTNKQAGWLWNKTTGGIWWPTTRDHRALLSWLQSSWGAFLSSRIKWYFTIIYLCLCRKQRSGFPHRRSSWLFIITPHRHDVFFGISYRRYFQTQRRTGSRSFDNPWKDESLSLGTREGGVRHDWELCLSGSRSKSCLHLSARVQHGDELPKESHLDFALPYEQPSNAAEFQLDAPFGRQESWHGLDHLVDACLNCVSVEESLVRENREVERYGGYLACGGEGVDWVRN